MNVAEKIIEHLGGSRFIAMTGAKQFVLGERSLVFGIGRGAINKANKIRVTLTSDDTYTVEAFRLRGVNLASCGTPIDRVYAGCLQAAFRSITGMDTHI